MNYQDYLRKKTKKDPNLKKRLEFENWLSEIGLNIAKIRKEKGYSQDELAKKMDIKQSMIARIESGHNFTCETIWKLGDSLEVDVVIFEASTAAETAKIDELIAPVSVLYESSWKNIDEDVQGVSIEIPTLGNIFTNNHNLNYNGQEKFCPTAA